MPSRLFEATQCRTSAFSCVGCTPTFVIACAAVTASVLVKSQFLDMLKGGEGKKAAPPAVEMQSSWLSTDFMMGAKMKDWDKEEAELAEDESEEEEEEDEEEEEGEEE